MLIILDIGNTSVTYGLYTAGRMVKFGSSDYDRIPKIVRNIYKSGIYKKIDIIFLSVVPQITRFLRKNLSKIPNSRLMEVGKDLPLSITHKYKPSSSLGIDRKVNIYGALRIYSPPLLIIDFGTAITFDYISRKGVFEGGMILPGPELSFQALIQRAALIPKRLRLPTESVSFIGKRTYECIQSGVLEGYGALTDGLIDRFRAQYGKKLSVIATGGFGRHLKPYSHKLTNWDPQHSIKSLLLLYKERVKAK